MQKSSFSPPSQSPLLFKALADETRLRILHLLVQGTLCVCEMVALLGASQSKTSRHLGVLRNAGLVEGVREGAWMHYSLSPPRSSAHERILEWMSIASEEIPHAEQDLVALAELRRQGSPCGPSPQKADPASPSMVEAACDR